nr:MAG TPA: hypothetical protein [Caudoviricetes sp.]
MYTLLKVSLKLLKAFFKSAPPGAQIPAKPSFWPCFPFSSFHANSLVFTPH